MRPATAAHPYRRLGTDELNLCEFPLTLLTHRPAAGQTSLTFEDEIENEATGKKVHRKFTISGNDAHGLPTPVDGDVLPALIRLTNARNQFTDRTVSFTRYEIVQFLGWDPGGKSYRRLDESLLRWTTVTLTYNHAWWDKARKVWRTLAFHVLDSLDLRGRDLLNSKGDDLVSSFTWNETIFQSIRARNVEELDLDVYYGLKSAIAKQMYRFLDKRFWKRKTLSFDLRAFACEHVGLSRQHDNCQLRRKLLVGIEELVEIGFLKPLPEDERFRKVTQGEWKITFERGRITHSVADTANANDSKLVEALCARGVARNRAREIVARQPEDLIREKLDIHDWLLERKAKCIAKNPPGFLVASIDRPKNYPLPALFLEEKRKKESISRPRRKVTHPNVVPPIRIEDPVHQAFMEYWRSLSVDERGALEREAVSQGDPMRVSSYERLRARGGALFDEVRDSLLMAYLKSRGIKLVTPTCESAA